MLGFEKIFHQPFEASSDCGRIDVMKRPNVGTSHSTPSSASTRWTGAFATQRRIFAAPLSRVVGSSTAGAATATVRPPV